jgi:hypothetical protein
MNFSTVNEDITRFLEVFNLFLFAYVTFARIHRFSPSSEYHICVAQISQVTIWTGKAFVYFEIKMTKGYTAEEILSHT